MQPQRCGIQGSKGPLFHSLATDSRSTSQHIILVIFWRNFLIDLLNFLRQSPSKHKAYEYNVVVMKHSLSGEAFDDIEITTVGKTIHVLLTKALTFSLIMD